VINNTFQIITAVSKICKSLDLRLLNRKIYSDPGTGNRCRPKSAGLGNMKNRAAGKIQNHPGSSGCGNDDSVPGTSAVLLLPGNNRDRRVCGSYGIIISHRCSVNPFRGNRVEPNHALTKSGLAETNIMFVSCEA